MCTCRPYEYKEVGKNLDLTIMKVSMGINKSIYDRKNVLEYNLKLRNWMSNFNGVATKYLNNYLSWFKFLYESDKFKCLSRIKALFMKFATENFYITKSMIRNRYVELI